MLLPHWGYGIFTQFHPFPPLSTHFVLISTTSTPFSLISPHHGDPEKAGVRLHMGNDTLRHLAMMYVNKPTTDDLDGESD